MDADRERQERLDRLAARRAQPQPTVVTTASAPLPPPTAATATATASATDAASRGSRRRRVRRHPAAAARILAAGTSGSMFLGVIAALAANPPDWSSAQDTTPDPSEAALPVPEVVGTDSAPLETDPAPPVQYTMVPPLDPSLGQWVEVPVDPAAPLPEGPPPVPETIVVVETIHRTVYVDENGNPTAPPDDGATPPSTSPPAGSPSPTPTTRPSGGGSPTTRPAPTPTTRPAPPPPPPPPPTTRPPTPTTKAPKPPPCTGSKC